MFVIKSEVWHWSQLLCGAAEYEYLQVMLLLTYALISAYLLKQHAVDKSVKERKVEKKSQGETSASQADPAEEQFLSVFEVLYLIGLILVEIYSSFLHTMIFKGELPFLPLMLISVYCASGMVWSWSQPDIIEVLVVKRD